MANNNETRGGSQEQHVKAGEQSHKNDDMSKSAGSSSGNQGNQGGTHEHNQKQTNHYRHNRQTPALAVPYWLASRHLCPLTRHVCDRHLVSGERGKWGRERSTPFAGGLCTGHVAIPSHC